MDFLTLSYSSNNHFKYQQIYEGIKENVLRGNLRAREKLPSKRQLAKELNVSINTIANAYDQLLAEGYIYTIERKGYFVESGTEFHTQGATLNQLPADLKETDVNKEDWVSLSHMSADISLFPFKEWMKCENKAVDNHKKELSELGHPQGPYKTRKTISRMIALSRGVVCEPEQIVIGAGSQLLIQQLMSIQDKKQIIAVENPGYSRFYRLLNKMGFYVKPIELDDKGIDIKEVASSKANYLFVTPSHQFPTGKIMPISRRIELLNWAVEEEGRYIVEDDYDSEFKYESDSIPSLQSLDRNQRVIYTGTFSKTLLPGTRISYMVLPPDLLREYRKHATDIMQFSNSLGLFTLHYFIENGSYSRHIKRMNHHYEMKRRLLIDQLYSKFKQEVYIEDIPAGLHFLARFKSDKTYEEVETKAKEEKLEIYTMRRFMLKEKKRMNNWIELVIGFANIDEEEIPEALDRLDRVIR
ncbi:PLP-dependent aminotransferase family protein [Oceanobacillus sp. J11TS1]|uniref:MocR-like transcriptional regulator GabR n=1 Tax=Oceanobacillus sp. J11TS1 TaxID=2807191 RepID=UPI001B2DB371|nr:PLP-dependent aminotransferase family protein [Oceanobacillus sp. J11TS1]GIO23553.1 HTH-type transcriptional regulatory protein GabR [Oceanobacillus sp. J11TS1]